MRRSLSVALLALALPVAGTAGAQEASPSVGLVFRGIESISETRLQEAEALAEFGHPNELWRVRAMMAVKRGDIAGAIERLHMAARYADKLSQHSLALLHWHGVGVERDRARAYAWNALAAERGYPTLERSRAAMWAQMEEAERQRAEALGVELRAEYGDAVAKPRMERELAQAKGGTTGSRVGSTINQLQVSSVSSRRVAHPDFYYAEQRWNPEQYWQGEDRVWKGKVVVGDTQAVTSLTAPGAAPEAVEGEDGAE